MQIEDVKVIGWLWWLVTVSVGAIVGLLGFIYFGDRKQMAADRARITALEKQMAQAATIQQVEGLADKLKAEFRSDHHGLDARLLRLDDKLERVEDGLKKEISESHDSLQGSINGIYNILTRPYAGQDRRKN